MQPKVDSSCISISFVTEEAIDSDGEFPNEGSGSDISDSEFHDALDQKPLKVVKATQQAEKLAHSRLNRSTFG